MPGRTNSFATVAGSFLDGDVEGAGYGFAQVGDVELSVAVAGVPVVIAEGPEFAVFDFAGYGFHAASGEAVDGDGDPFAGVEAASFCDFHPVFPVGEGGFAGVGVGYGVDGDSQGYGGRGILRHGFLTFRGWPRTPLRGIFLLLVSPGLGLPLGRLRLLTPTSGARGAGIYRRGRIMATIIYGGITYKVSRSVADEAMTAARDAANKGTYRTVFFDLDNCVQGLLLGPGIAIATISDVNPDADASAGSLGAIAS